MMSRFEKYIKKLCQKKLEETELICFKSQFEKMQTARAFFTPWTYYDGNPTFRWILNDQKSKILKILGVIEGQINPKRSWKIDALERAREWVEINYKEIETKVMNSQAILNLTEDYNEHCRKSKERYDKLRAERIEKEKLLGEKYLTEKLNNLPGYIEEIAKFSSLLSSAIDVLDVHLTHLQEVKNTKNLERTEADIALIREARNNKKITKDSLAKFLFCLENQKLRCEEKVRDYFLGSGCLKENWFYLE